MIRLRHLRLRSITIDRVFGADIPFGPGLNVIQAENTSGKSTCLQSIIYALGLERSLGPQLSIPLPYAMRERVHEAEQAPYEMVLESYVELEIENKKGEIVTLRRDVVGGKDTKLIRTWDTPGLSEDRRGTQRDFYVLDGGAATRESGFHNFLSQFMGWDLPFVSRFDGTECPLYLEAIFPMLFVEQKRGWSTIQGPFPTYLRIQDVTRRVMEFLLDLEAARNRRRRAELNKAVADASNRWATQRRSLEEQASRIGRIRGLPQQPSAEFALSPVIALEMYYQGEWARINDVIQIVGSRITELEGIEPESVEDAAPLIEQKVIVLHERIDELSAIIETLRNSYGAELQEVNALDSRLKSLEADLKRNQDAQKLQKLGSELGRAASEHVCPTCHQGVTSELLPAVESVGMALDENISFVKSQIELYKAAQSNSRERLQDCIARYRGTERDLRDKQQQLRTLRQELVRPSAAPSRAMIEEIVRLQAFLERVQSVDNYSITLTDDLKEIAAQWAVAVNDLKKLPSDELTFADRQKVEMFQTSIRRHLERYGFRSFQPNEISLSLDNFRPLVFARDQAGEVVEKEINFEVSASDAIRLKWAYYLSMLEISNAKHTNHPGVAIFDEPGQQEVDTPSLLSFLNSASASKKYNQQVIVTTSESRSKINDSLSEVAWIVNFPGFILQPIA